MQQNYNVKGMINSLDLTGCIASIGNVDISINRADLQVLLDCVADIQNQKRDGSIVIPRNVRLNDSDWLAIGYLVNTSTYNLNFRGVCWEVPSDILQEFINQAALPFLARGTVNELLKLIVE